MKKVLQIMMRSELGLFKKMDSNDFAITYNFPPKPQVLGMLGAIIGLEGYCVNSSNPEFYEKLKDLKISIQPLDENWNEALKIPLKKTIVVYNNFHGYGSKEQGGILQVREQLLIRPGYRIFIKGETEQYNKLKNKLEAQEYFYTPYLGKNEFLAEVIYEGEKDCEKCTKESVEFSSIFLQEYNEQPLIIHRGGKPLPNAFFLMKEEYPISFDNNYFYKTKIAVYTNATHNPNYDKLEKDGYEICEIDGKQFFFI